MARMFERRSNQRHAGRVGVAATRKLKMARMFERRSNHFSFERPFPLEMARSERFELPTLGIEIRCSIQLSYERNGVSISGQPCERKRPCHRR